MDIVENTKTNYRYDIGKIPSGVAFTTGESESTYMRVTKCNVDVIEHADKRLAVDLHSGELKLIPIKFRVFPLHSAKVIPGESS